MLIESACVPDAALLSVAFTVKFAVPDAVGVPLICPPELSAKPAGKAPDANDH
jgi:hypothetical protein